MSSAQYGKLWILSCLKHITIKCSKACFKLNIHTFRIYNECERSSHRFCHYAKDSEKVYKYVKRMQCNGAEMTHPDSKQSLTVKAVAFFCIQQTISSTPLDPTCVLIHMMMMGSVNHGAQLFVSLLRLLRPHRNVAFTFLRGILEIERERSLKTHLNF